MINSLIKTIWLIIEEKPREIKEMDKIVEYFLEFMIYEGLK